MNSRRHDLARLRAQRTSSSSESVFSHLNRTASRCFCDGNENLQNGLEGEAPNVALETSRDAAAISVVAPVGVVPVSFLKEAVESVLNQTFRDFEFIIVDDGATEECRNYLESLTDERVRIIRNPENLGITKSLNIGFRAAQGKYIARMDADDVCMPERFQRQYDFMESHPSAIVCGTIVQEFGDSHWTTWWQIVPDMETYRVRMIFRNPGPYHPTAFFNRELLLRHNLFYDESLVYAQDYGLYAEIAKRGDVYILPEPLLYYRIHSRQTSKTRRETQIRCDQATQKKLLVELLERDVSDEELDLHYRYSTLYYDNMKINRDVSKWYRRLIKANNRALIYERIKFNHEVYYLLKRTVHLSVSPSMTLFQKTALFFRHLPFFMALKETIAIGARKFVRAVKIIR